MLASPGISKDQMATPQSYIMGHNERERRRLTVQASVLRPITERFLEDAGEPS